MKSIDRLYKEQVTHPFFLPCMVPKGAQLYQNVFFSPAEAASSCFKSLQADSVSSPGGVSFYHRASVTVTQKQDK